MTSPESIAIFEGIAAPSGDDAETPAFAVRPVPNYRFYFVGKDSAGYACLLIETTDETRRKPPPIRLESLDAQFQLACLVRDAGGSVKEGSFTVVRCRSHDLETVRYFLSVCEIIMRSLGDKPSRAALSTAVRRIASIFQDIKKAPVRSLNGLFGELFVILRSRSPARALAAWRIAEESRFDFASGDIRMDVKSCAGRVRIHAFSYDQCSPPPDTQAIVASLMVERIPGGISIDEVMVAIENRVSGDQDLVLKLHETVASTLGQDFPASLGVTFDQRLAASSLKFFDLRTIPAIRGCLPSGVSDVRFSADLSGIDSVSMEALVDLDPYFLDLLPGD